MSDKFIFNKLPFDIIREILLYDKHFVLRKQNNRLICINKIQKIDEQFVLYNTIPKIFRMSNNSWSVILGKDKRFVLSRSLQPSLHWLYSFSFFSRDKHTNIMNWIPDTTIYFP